MNFFEKKYLPYLTLFLLVFISRIPFLNAGYGIEEDSWGIALAAFHTNISGVYEPSRFPGHPVQELIYSILWGVGPYTFNLLSNLFSSTAVVFFALILKHLNFKHFFLASLAFAFVPVFYISSTYTIDFAWTEAFVLISFYSLLKDKFIFCGIFLGMAIGCRITSGAMLIPYAIIFWQQKKAQQNFTSVSKIILPMMIVVVLAFLPLITQFGFNFFMYYDQFPYPPVSKVLYKMIPGVFGFIGCLSIIICLISIFIKSKKRINESLFESGLNNRIIIAGFFVIILYTISYLRLPQKSGYIIPMIPFIILLFGNYLNSKYFKLLCISFIISPFFCSINLTDRFRGASHSKYALVFTLSGQELFFDVFSGPLFSDYSKRIQKLKYTDEVINKANIITTKTVIISGWWYNEIMVTMIPLPKNQFVIYEPYIDNNKINKYLSDDYVIVYLSEQNIYNDLMFKMTVTDKVSKEFTL